MQHDAAFTLIELLVTITIVGILTAIAVPYYHAYRQRSFDVRASSDLRNAALAEEAYFMDAERYLSCAQEECTALPGLTRLSKGVQLAMLSGDDAFTGTATHLQGSGKIFQWDSEAGGFQE